MVVVCEWVGLALGVFGGGGVAMLERHAFPPCALCFNIADPPLFLCCLRKLCAGMLEDAFVHVQ
jgi:hypothetical protein